VIIIRSSYILFYHTQNKLFIYQNLILFIINKIYNCFNKVVLDDLILFIIIKIYNCFNKVVLDDSIRL